jgi:NAD(P)H-hydrate epimerase
MTSEDLLPNALFSVTQVRAIERGIMQTQNITDDELMQRVAEQMWQQIILRWPTAHHLLVCCGPGNNAGDGYVIATLAKQRHKEVRVLTAIPLTQLTGAARLAAEAAQQAGVVISLYSGELPTAELYIDALFGIGLQREIAEPYRQWIAQLNQQSAPVVAVDMPSGIAADTGAVLGVAVHASLTLTALVLKIGLFTGEAVDYVGEVHCVADDVVTDLPLPLATRVTHADFLQWPLRSRNSHKGLQGHVLIVGGDHGMGGAVILAAEAALRAGAGLVTVATRAAHINALLTRLPEVMSTAIESPEDVLPLFARASVVVIGPGLGQNEWGLQLLHLSLQCKLPLVMDADALNLLALNSVAIMETQALHSVRHWVLTPHPKEAARLLNGDVQSIQCDRASAVQQLSAQWQATVLLKGAGTLIASPDKTVRLIDRGNGGMAVAGMGDALTGIIAALIAQGLALPQATALAAWLHAITGDHVAARQGIRGMRTTDLIAQLPLVMQQLSSKDKEKKCVNS